MTQNRGRFATHQSNISVPNPCGNSTVPIYKEKSAVINVTHLLQQSHSVTSFSIALYTSICVRVPPSLSKAPLAIWINATYSVRNSRNLAQCNKTNGLNDEFLDSFCRYIVSFCFAILSYNSSFLFVRRLLPWGQVPASVLCTVRSCRAWHASILPPIACR